MSIMDRKILKYVVKTDRLNSCIYKKNLFFLFRLLRLNLFLKNFNLKSKFFNGVNINNIDIFKNYRDIHMLNISSSIFYLMFLNR